MFFGQTSFLCCKNSIFHIIIATEGVSIRINRKKHTFVKGIINVSPVNDAPIANVDYDESITSLAQKLELGRARRVVSDLESALSRLDRNVNPRLLAEVLLLDLPEV